MNDPKHKSTAIVTEEQWAEILSRIERGDTSVATEVMWIQSFSAAPRTMKQSAAREFAAAEPVMAD